MSSSYPFPDDLIAAQRDLQQATADLNALYERLPHSPEPTEAFHDSRETGYWRERQRDASPGWTDDEKAEEVKLRDRRLELADAIVTHDFWSTLAEADRPKARSALKHIDKPQDGG
ncbi:MULTISPECIES: hypothetical protein [Streptomyces]|uniref:hypothetical protein n=1 Tax=Streptomyces TaxID=1883 RepID=UPI0004CD1EAD|nr:MULTISPECIES: hypothetical protein [Streptomyces]